MKPSRSGNPPARSPGRFPWVLLAAGAALLAIPGSLYLFSGPEKPERFLLVITEAGDVSTSGDDTPSWIAEGRNGDKDLRILTGEFWSATSPSVSHDGRRFLFIGRRTREAIPGIWEMGIRKAASRRITKGNGAPDEPAYLPDGRILFSDVPPGKDGKGNASRSIFSCASDGSDVRRLTFGRHRDSRPEVLPDGRIRFRRGFQTSGRAPAALTMTIRPDGTGLARFLGDPPESPHPVAGSAMDPGEGRKLLDAIVVANRPVPPVLTSIVNKKRSTGTLLCLNAYESQLPRIANLPPGSIQRVRITEAETPSGWEGKTTRVPVLAEAPVFPDGSFFVEVPADTPLRLTLLGKGGRELASLETGIWVRPNENRGCIGCHENPELAPENRVPIALTQAASGSKREGGFRGP